MKVPPQWQRILNYMTIHGKIDDTAARDYIGCRRLAARIFDLTRKGYNIGRADKVVTDRYGQTTTVKEYWLE